MYFVVLEEFNNPGHSVKYSVLEPEMFTSNNNIDHDNEDLKEILRGLDILNVKPKEKKELAVPTPVDMENSFTSHSAVSGKQIHEPTYPDKNIDPLEHIKNFYADLYDASTFKPVGTDLVLYPALNPNPEPQPEDVSVNNPSIASSDEALQNMLPKFGEIGIGLDLSDEGDEEVESRHNSLENINIDEAIEKVKQTYTGPEAGPEVVIPTVVNSLSGSVSVSQEEQLETQTSFEVPSTLDVSQPVDTSTPVRTGIKNLMGANLPKEIHTEQLESIENEDDLFKSGSPPTTGSDMMFPNLEPIAEATTGHFSSPVMTGNYRTPVIVTMPTVYQRPSKPVSKYDQLTSVTSAVCLPAIVTTYTCTVTTTCIPIGTPIGTSSPYAGQQNNPPLAPYFANMYNPTTGQFELKVVYPQTPYTSPSNAFQQPHAHTYRYPECKPPQRHGGCIRESEFPSSAPIFYPFPEGPSTMPVPISYQNQVTHIEGYEVQGTANNMHGYNPGHDGPSTMPVHIQYPNPDTGLKVGRESLPQHFSGNNPRPNWMDPQRNLDPRLMMQSKSTAPNTQSHGQIQDSRYIYKQGVSTVPVVVKTGSRLDPSFEYRFSAAINPRPPQPGRQF